jgi:hypothetical protein
LLLAVAAGVLAVAELLVVVLVVAPAEMLVLALM